MKQDEFPRIRHHGAVTGVTGSCHRLQVDPDHAVLVDCGLFQGDDRAGDDELERQRIDFDISDVSALVVTHVHIDHVGRIPYLVAAGFDGPIICSVPSSILLPLVIEDALKVGFTRDRLLIDRFLARVGRQLVPLDYDEWHTVLSTGNGDTRVRLQRAGHILGSAYVEFDVPLAKSERSRRIVFSGDLGAPHAPLLPSPRSPRRADIVVIESTYGDRIHEDRRQRKKRLKQAIERAVADGGTVLVPAFSIGRTQELLYELEDIIHASSDDAWAALEIIVDSPLAARFTEAYRQLRPWWDAEAKRRTRKGRHPLDFESLYTVDTHAAHERTVKYLAASRRPAVVLAASGMAAGGRIVNYLKAMIGEPRHNVLFVGYQAPGTPGRAIQQHGAGHGWVELDGERYVIRAGIETIGGYSAHADQSDLVRFVQGIRNGPRHVRIVHGDDRAKRALKRQLETRHGGRPGGMFVDIGTAEETLQDRRA